MRRRTSDELVELLTTGGLEAPILPEADARWGRLRRSPEPGVELRDRFRGALVGGAIGDAMGRPAEGWPPEAARAERIRAYRPWRPGAPGPTGTITDDTQMTMWLAEAMLAAAANPPSRRGAESRGSEEQEPGDTEAGAAGLRDRLIDPPGLVTRFTGERIRGIGRATREFLHNVKVEDRPWHLAGVPSAGNGAAMRAAPVGLVHLGDPYRCYRDSLLQAAVTHRDSMAIASAACQAYAVARAAAAPAGSLAPLEARLALCADLATLLEGLERPGYAVRGGSGAPSLHARIGTELPRYLREGGDPFPDWYNGAYVLETLPCALWCFLAGPEAFEGTLFTAVDAGHDADTVAAMACSLAGAYHGYTQLPPGLVGDLEYHDHLIELADGLYDLHGRLHGAA